MKIKAIIFDMDGVLIDSEPHWRLVEARVFKEYGITLTEEAMRSTQGMRIDEAVWSWCRDLGWADEQCAEARDQIVRGMVEWISAHGEAMPGATSAIERATQTGLPLAVASSSPDVVINTTLERLGIRREFAVVHSAEHEERGKPDPGIYLHVAELLAVKPGECLVVEDSVNGIKAAKAAGMKCLAFPDPVSLGKPEYRLADKIVRSLDEIDWPAILSECK